MCYSDHQGQASAKRQGKFKKVLDELETLYNRASTALLPSGKWLIPHLRDFVISALMMSKHVNVGVLKYPTSLVVIGIYVDVQFLSFLVVSQMTNGSISNDR